MTTLVAALFSLLHLEHLDREDGLEAVEYALIAALVAVAIIGAVTLMREQIIAVFGAIQTALSGAAAAN